MSVDWFVFGRACFVVAAIVGMIGGPAMAVYGSEMVAPAYIKRGGLVFIIGTVCLALAFSLRP